MKSFSTTAIIHSSPETIWAILTDVSNWPTWNSTVDKVEGKVALGEKIAVYAKTSPGRAFPLKVVECVPRDRMVWSGGLPLGLFEGKRTYTLTERTDGSVEFTMREIYSGLMAGVLTQSVPDLQPSFDEFAAALT